MNAIRGRFGQFLGAGSRLAVVVAMTVIGGLAVILAAGIVTSGGSQAAPLVQLPQPTPDLMPMGNAHIPTTNACLLCHGAAGEVKVVPALLHPVEGWRRCTTCHSDQNLGRKAPGHEGIPEVECLNCHKVAEAGPAITRPHAALQGKGCLECHGGYAHLPSSMASMQETDCVLCHKATDLPPPSYPHATDNRLACSSCHRSPEAGGLPIDHARRTDGTCLLCHEIATVDPSRTFLPLPSGLAEPSGSPPGS
jgi:hypothetical protein